MALSAAATDYRKVVVFNVKNKTKKKHLIAHCDEQVFIVFYFVTQDTVSARKIKR